MLLVFSYTINDYHRDRDEYFSRVPETSDLITNIEKKDSLLFFIEDFNSKINENPCFNYISSETINVVIDSIINYGVEEIEKKHLFIFDILVLELCKDQIEYDEKKKINSNSLTKAHKIIATQCKSVEAFSILYNQIEKKRYKISLIKILLKAMSYTVSLFKHFGGIPCVLIWDQWKKYQKKKNNMKK